MVVFLLLCLSTYLYFTLISSFVLQANRWKRNCWQTVSCVLSIGSLHNIDNCNEDATKNRFLSLKILSQRFQIFKFVIKWWIFLEMNTLGP